MASTSESRFDSAPADIAAPLHLLVLALHHLEVGQRRLRVEYAATLKLTNSEFNALTTIGQAGEVTPKALSNTLHMTTGAVTAILDRLEQSGLVVRYSNPRDRRSVLIEPTAQGHDALRWLLRKYSDAVDKMITGESEFLDPAFIELLHRAGRSMVDEADNIAGRST